MIEVEVKALARPDTRQRILDLGGVYLKTENHRDLYFNSPLQDFQQSDEALRIRVKEGGASLTYKGPKLDSETKSRMELTVGVEDPQALEHVLNALGFVRAGEVRKQRAKYRLGDLTLALDEVEGLGSFLEIEARGGDDWEGRRREVLDLLGKLGLGGSIRISYLEMLQQA
jgi:adenylate cyclase class 2